MFVLVNLIMSYAPSLLGNVTNEAARERCTILRAALAASKVRLVQAPFTFQPSSTLVAAEAAEADYDGYTAGGNTLATWGAPLDAPSGGAAIAAETTFAYVDGVGHAANNVSGGWVELATGEIVASFNFAAPITLQKNGDGFVLQLLDTEAGVTA
jgi:hypothetical protein